MEQRVYGSRSRTECLILLSLLEEVHLSEVAEILGASVSNIHRLFSKLEVEGLVASRLTGQQRRIRLNPSYFAKRELAALLQKLADNEPDLINKIGQFRRRSRRPGKEI